MEAWFAYGESHAPSTEHDLAFLRMPHARPDHKHRERKLRTCHLATVIFVTAKVPSIKTQ